MPPPQELQTTLEGVMKFNKVVARLISNELRPLKPRLPHEDLSSLSRTSKELHKACKPYLFHTVNLERIYLWEGTARMDDFFENCLEWKEGTRDQVRHLIYPKANFKIPLPVLLDFAVRLPNLQTLRLPVRKTYDLVEGVQFEKLTKLESLRCSISNPQYDKAIALPIIRTLDFWLADLEELMDPDRANISTPAEKFYLVGETLHLVDLHQEDFDWNYFAPNTKHIVIKHRGPSCVDPTPEDVHAPFAFLRDIKHLETLTVYVPKMIRQNVGSDDGSAAVSSFFTPFGYTNDLEKLDTQIMNALNKDGGCPNLQRIQLAVQIVDYVGVEADEIDVYQLGRGGTVGIAVQEEEEMDEERQCYAFAFWETCTVSKSAEGEWVTNSWGKLMNKNDPDYPYIFDVWTPTYNTE